MAPSVLSGSWEPTHHRVLSPQLGCSSPGHSTVIPALPSLLPPRSNSCSEGLEVTKSHKSLQLADVAPQFSSLETQDVPGGSAGALPCPVAPMAPVAQDIPKNLQLAGRVL
jgi:hypothetical protein